MVYPSVEFAIFFPIVLWLSWLLMPRPRIWKPFILVASYAFYGSADVRFTLLLAAVTLGTQLGATLVARTNDPGRRKWVTAATVTFDLAILGVFKYYGFFVGQFDARLDSIGLGAPLPLLQIALPVGLSFFTFQAISYVVDVKRGLCARAATLDVAIYLSFFPHLVAGPIVRAREFLPQLAKPRDPRDVAVGAGVLLIAIGLVKKVVIADALARGVVDPVYAVPEAYYSPDVLLALLAYAVQIYCDFSGYTDMSIGLALLMGFIFPQNFNSPYRATSFRDFWQRWHMTLSRFLRDFLYIPLGGNRCGAVRTSVNLMLTMVLGGLWHGAAWGFVLWGFIHGSALVIEHLLRNRGLTAPVVLRWAIVFTVVVVAWVPFRAPNLDVAVTVVQQLFTPGSATLWAPVPVLFVALVLGLQLAPARTLERLRLRVEAWNPVPLAAGLTATIVIVAATVPGGAVPPFIYFAF